VAAAAAAAAAVAAAAVAAVHSQPRRHPELLLPMVADMLTIVSSQAPAHTNICNATGLAGIPLPYMQAHPLPP
jgi:hypothetical protein